MSGRQGAIFAASEGDRWFARNRAALARFDPAADLPLRLLELYGVHPRRALEIGAANGYRLAALVERYGAHVVAVEPSFAAIRDGTAHFPAVTFVRGDAAAIPLGEPFDLVIAHFVLHWLDRSSLLRAVAEIDRLLVDGGFLVIGDFLPANLLRVLYHHRAEDDLYTYKQNYAAIFLASGLYHPVGLLTADDRCALDAAAGEATRTGTWLLRKQLTEHYAAVPRA